MATRSLNKIQLIGNLTRDPELRYTSSGTAVCSSGLATNRSWTVDSGERKEEAEFHRLVSWNKLAELCSQLLAKGRKIYVEGRIQTRNWEGQDGNQRTTTEIVISDMIILDSRKGFEERSRARDVEVDTKPIPEKPVVEKEDSVPEEVEKDIKDEDKDTVEPASKEDPATGSGQGKKSTKEAKSEKTEDINPDDIPF